MCLMWLTLSLTHMHMHSLLHTHTSSLTLLHSFTPSLLHPFTHSHIPTLCPSPLSRVALTHCGVPGIASTREEAASFCEQLMKHSLLTHIEFMRFFKDSLVSWHHRLFFHTPKQLLCPSLTTAHAPLCPFAFARDTAPAFVHMHLCLRRLPCLHTVCQVCVPRVGP